MANTADITPQSKISVALLGGIFAVLTTGLVAGARAWARLEYQVESISAAVKDLASQNVTRNEFAMWTDRLSELNPEIKTPKPVPR